MTPARTKRSSPGGAPAAAGKPFPAGHDAACEDWFRTIADFTHDWEYWVSPERKFLYVSPSCERITGYQPEEFLEDPQLFKQIVHPDDLARVEEHEQSAKGEAGEKSLDFRIVARGGQVRWINHVCQAVYSRDGHWLGMRASNRDITEQKQAAEAQAEANMHYRALFNQSHDAIFILDLEGRQLDSNQRAADLLGYTREELRALSFRDISAEIPQSEQMIQRLLKGEHIPLYERAFRRKDGSRVLVEINVELVRDAKGAPVYIQSVARDITERKEAEEKLRQNLRHSALLLDASEALVRSLNLSETLQTLVEKAVAMIEVETGAIYLLEDNDLYLWATTPPLPADFPETLRRARLDDHPHIRQALASGKAVILPDTLAADLTEAERAVSELRRLRTVVYLPILGSKGIPGVLILGRIGSPRSFSQEQLDLCRTLGSQAAVAIENARLYQSIQKELAARKQAEEEIRRLNAELEQRVEARTRQLHDAQEQLVRQEKLAVLGQLAGGVGHELRNPLSVISNAVYFLKLVQPDASPEVREYLDILGQETRTAEKIIGDLLEFSRTKSVDREPVPVEGMLQQVLERFPTPENIAVKFNIPAGLPPIFADPRHMQQVFGNLVVNACQAMPEGGALSLSARAKGKEIAIAVADTGTGIPPENMGKLFEPLFTTKAKGIGLGLAVSRKLVEANGGRIQVQSTLGAGTTFTVYLPRIEVKA